MLIEDKIELSTLQPMTFTKSMNYLIRYPHGCVEQTTSAAFPQLYLGEVFNLSSEKKQVENAGSEIRAVLID